MCVCLEARERIDTKIGRANDNRTRTNRLNFG